MFSTHFVGLLYASLIEFGLLNCQIMPVEVDFDQRFDQNLMISDDSLDETWYYCIFDMSIYSRTHINHQVSVLR